LVLLVKKTTLYKERNEKKRKEFCLEVDNIEISNRVAPAVLPIMNHAEAILEFGKYVQLSLDFFLGKSDKPPIKYTLKDCDDFSGMLNPIANDGGSNINISLVNKGEITLNFADTSSTEANAMQNKINKYKEELKLPESNSFNKEVLYWRQTQFGKKSKSSGDKAVIEKISSNPLRVIFATDDLKEEMTTYNEKLDKDWQDLAYVVDVEVGTIQDIPKYYRIIKLYTDETFDPED